MKKCVPLMLFGAVLGMVVILCISMVTAGKVSLVMNGFAVDEDGLLYIGREREIVVLNDGEHTRTIDVPTSRTYKFTIVDGQTILLSTSTKLYTMDLFGNVLSENTDEGTKVYNQLQWKKTYIAQNGQKYTLDSHWGRMCIYKDDTAIYTMPLFDYIVRILLGIPFITLLFLGVVILIMKIFERMKTPQ